MEVKFYVCEICGKIVMVVKDAPVPTMCCGKPMKELVPGTTDGAAEKHVPVVDADGKTITVKIGEVEHPMAEEHYIEWIAIATREGFQMKDLKPGEKPEAVFALTDADELLAAYEYCNIHGLWKK